MINSRNIEYLHPKIQVLASKLIEVAQQNNIKLIITSTYRDFDSQDDLYAQGRTKPGKIVTNARAGESFHNFKVAFDVAPVVEGKIVWNDGALWDKIGALGESLGLEWGGSWESFKDKPHFQFTGGLTLEDFRLGKKLDA